MFDKNWHIKNTKRHCDAADLIRSDNLRKLEKKISRKQSVKSTIVLSVVATVCGMWRQSNPKTAENEKVYVLCGRAETKVDMIIRKNQLSKPEQDYCQRKLDDFFDRLKWTDGHEVDIGMGITLAACLLESLPNKPELVGLGKILTEIMVNIERTDTDEDYLQYKAGLDAAAVWKEIVG